MKLKCQRDEILSGIQAVQSIVSTKGTLPILSNVLLEAVGDELILTTTDLEVGMRTRVKAKVSAKGAITIPAKRLFAILRELPVSEVVMESDGKKEMVIRYDSSYFKVLGLPKDDFPPFPDFQKNRALKIAQAPFADLIRKTHYAVSTDESRYVLNGLYLIFGKGKITGVATDGRRLAHCEMASPVPDGIDRGIIVPSKAVMELGRMLTGTEGDMEIFLGENQVAFNKGDCTLVTRLIEGHFPNYQQVIPQKATIKLQLDRAELLAAVRRVGLLTSEQANSVKLALKKNRIIISSNTPDVGEAREELVISYAGEEVTIAFNPQYMLDALKNLEEKEIALEVTDGLNPGVIRSGKSFLYVIMPIRIA
ncbi:MAG: DNA polymerase III subunit beta [Candidatus Aureabacteria bacterium]|nr:DNA polymerase III subunit beta [Candidatus Auribacterota bacterium]